MKRVLNDDLRVDADAEPAEFGLRDLMVAVLENALDTFKEGLGSPVPAKRVEAFKVEAWVASDDVDWPFAFRNVCDHLGISPEYVRACMASWRRKAARDDETTH